MRSRINASILAACALSRFRRDRKGSVAIEFAFIEDCWLEATDARGARLFYGLGQAGALRRVTGEPPIDVILGNADGVALTVDGEPYVVPNRNRQGNLARLAITGSSD